MDERRRQFLSAFFSGVGMAFDMGGSHWSSLPSMPRVLSPAEAAEADRAAMAEDFAATCADFVDALADESRSRG